MYVFYCKSAKKNLPMGFIFPPQCIWTFFLSFFYEWQYLELWRTSPLESKYCHLIQFSIDESSNRCTTVLPIPSPWWNHRQKWPQSNLKYFSLSNEVKPTTTRANGNQRSERRGSVRQWRLTRFRTLHGRQTARHLVTAFFSEHAH